MLKIPKQNSFFLFGARGTGKSSLLREHFSKETTRFVDLLDADTEAALARAPSLFAEQVRALPTAIKTVVLDEVQKVPALLDITHQLIEEKRGLQFALTGSSARKLKRGQANLLAGRAFVTSLHPLTHRELGDAFELDRALAFGTMPHLYALADDEERARYLRAYSLTYFREEIVAEQIVRRVEPFRHFLEIASQQNATIVNYASIARDVGVDANTVQSYFEILEDTLLGVMLPPYHASVRRRQRKNPKFYLFDLGVKRALDRTLSVPLLPQTYAYGQAFEHWVVVEAHRLNAYEEKDYRFSYLRTQNDVEIDLIVERPGLPLALIEIKSARSVKDEDLRSLKQLRKDFANAEAFCFCRETTPRVVDGITVLDWRMGLRAIGLSA